MKVIDLYYNLGNAQKFKGDVGNSIDSYEGCKIKSKHFNAYLNMGINFEKR